MKNKVLFECIECGYQSPKYYGKCPHCQNWNSMVELSTDDTVPGESSPDRQAVSLTSIEESRTKRVQTGLDEFDRVLGGGIVPDSVILIGGEPGVGKSTLLLEVSGILTQAGKKTLYYSGEESAHQIKSRANRLNINSSDIFLLTMGSISDLKKAALELKPQFIIIDSIQTLQPDKHSLVSGSISSMKWATSEIIEFAKKNEITVFVIGHITKDGSLAGPKTLEHMVDVVLYFQGEFKSGLRILRAEKNRFGPVNELGIFQMSGQGLSSVKDPSQLFLEQRSNAESGISVFPAMNGLRPILTEIQALVTESPFSGNPRRISVGFDNYRMSMLISVIEKKLKLPFYKSDVFLNITGGLSIRETAGDLAVLSALISSYKNINIPRDIVIIGEVGLTGEVRSAGYIDNRIKEAVRQGFKQFILPASQANPSQPKNISIISVENIFDFYNQIGQKK